MPQIVPGLDLGTVGGQAYGSAHPMILTGDEPPSQNPDPNVGACSNGSLYLNVLGSVGSTLYCKISNVWTAIA